MSETSASALDAPLPARWGRVQRWKNTLIYWFVLALVTLARRVPLRAARRIGRGLGALAARVDRPDRARATAQIAAALPELEPRLHGRIAREMFKHLGMCAAEMLHLDRVLVGPPPVMLSSEQRALIDEALAEGRGVIAVSGHIGNWELLPQVVARAGFPISGIARPLYDPRLTRLAHRMRTQSGMKMIWRGDAAVSKDMLRVFRNREILALLIDQDTKVQGAFVPFFGRPAHTPTAAAALALRFEAPIIVAWCHRVAEGFALHFERHRFTSSGDHERDVTELTAQLTARLEHAIRAAPAQWVWLHRRWKRQPPRA